MLHYRKCVSVGLYGKGSISMAGCPYTTDERAHCPVVGLSAPSAVRGGN